MQINGIVQTRNTDKKMYSIACVSVCDVPVGSVYRSMDLVPVYAFLVFAQLIICVNVNSIAQMFIFAYIIIDIIIIIIDDGAARQSQHHRLVIFQESTYVLAVVMPARRIFLYIYMVVIPNEGKMCSVMLREFHLKISIWHRLLRTCKVLRRTCVSQISGYDF